jgi:hypothetical protein
VSDTIFSMRFSQNCRGPPVVRGTQVDEHLYALHFAALMRIPDCFLFVCRSAYAFMPPNVSFTWRSVVLPWLPFPFIFRHSNAHCFYFRVTYCYTSCAYISPISHEITERRGGIQEVPGSNFYRGYLFYSILPRLFYTGYPD